MSFPGAGVWKGQCSVTFIEGHQSDNKIGKYPFVMDQDVAGLSQLIHCLTLAREESVGQAHGIVLECPDGVDVPSIDAASRRDQAVEWARRRVVARLVRVVAHPRVLGIPGLPLVYRGRGGTRRDTEDASDIVML
eukprot:COSAG06_NODE_362_length_16812_cov_106.557710_11_plen_135_part_00